MKKALAEKIQHAEERISHHSAKNFEWVEVMNQRENQYEKARDNAEFHATRADGWNENLISLKNQQDKELGYTNAINKFNHIISVLDGLPRKFQAPVFRMLMDKKWRHETSLTHEEKELLSILWRINDEKDS